MLMSASFLASALIQFALGLVVAWLLGPAEFGVYALALAGAVLLQNLTLEWLRLCATRFHHAAEGGRLARRLHALFLRLGAGLFGLSILLFLFGGAQRIVLALVPLLSIAAGFADLRAALMRAEFDQRGYALFMLLRNALAIVLLPLAAHVFGEAAMVLAAFLTSLVLASLILAGARRGKGADAAVQADGEMQPLGTLLGYAMPIVATNCLYLGLFFVLRSGVAWFGGLAAAGQFSLALDFGLKLFTTIGTALDLMLFQFAVRDQRELGDAAGMARLTDNLGKVVAVVLPMAIGLWLVAPALEPWLVAPAFRGPFAAFLNALLPGLTLYLVVQFGLHPFLQLERATLGLVGAAGIAVAVGLSAAFLAYGLALPPAGAIAMVLTGAMAGATLRLLMRIGRAAMLPVGLFGRLGLALGAMVAGVSLMERLVVGLPGLVLMVLAGGVTYGALAYVTDLAGIRTLVRMRRREKEARTIS